jgi:hypothetical protein
VGVGVDLIEKENAAQSNKQQNKQQTNKATLAFFISFIGYVLLK